MNIENIEERLLRAERERDEARAEVARMRASQNERAIAEVSSILNEITLAGDGKPLYEQAAQARNRGIDMCKARIAALRAEQAAAPAPVTPSITPSPMDTASTAVRWDAYEQAKKDVDAWPEWKRKAAGAAFDRPEPVTPPADAPQRPSIGAIEDLRDFILEDWRRDDHGPDAIDRLQRAVRFLLEGALAARGEGAK